jgi:hypothetical protein
MAEFAEELAADEQNYPLRPGLKIIFTISVLAKART